MHLFTDPLIRVCNQKLIFLTDVVATQWDGSFEHPKQMLKLMDKKIFTLLPLPIWTYDKLYSILGFGYIDCLDVARFTWVVHCTVYTDS